MRKFVFNFHLYLALGSGLLVAVFGLTGAIMAFEPELDHLLHPKLWYVTPAARTISLAELAAIADKSYPNESLAYYVSTSPDLSYQVVLRRDAIRQPVHR